MPQTFTFLADFFNSTIFKISELYMLANSTTMGLLALYFCIVLGYEYTKIYAEEELDLAPMSGALLSMFAFFLSIPQLMVVDSSMERIIDQDNTIIND